MPVVPRRFRTRAESVLTPGAIPSRSMRSWAGSMRRQMRASYKAGIRRVQPRYIVLVRLRRTRLRGFLVKGMALDDILTAIRVVAAGDAIIAPGVIRRPIAQFTSEPRPGRKPRELTGITDREREVLRLVGLGLSNAEIAAALYSTGSTTKTHVARLLAKPGGMDRVHLVITAYETGLVTAPH